MTFVALEVNGNLIYQNCSSFQILPPSHHLKSAEVKALTFPNYNEQIDLGPSQSIICNQATWSTFQVGLKIPLHVIPKGADSSTMFKRNLEKCLAGNGEYRPNDVKWG